MVQDVYALVRIAVRCTAWRPQLTLGKCAVTRLSEYLREEGMLARSTFYLPAQRLQSLARTDSGSPRFGRAFGRT